ncbi:MAG: tetratricopeptide repeat protein [Candidatus Heimdallarchaeota archaeon]
MKQVLQHKLSSTFHYGESNLKQSINLNFETTIARVPSFGLSYRRGIKYIADRNYSRALEFFFQEIKDKPHSFIAWTIVGYLHYLRGMDKLASSCIHAALRLKPDYENAEITRDSFTKTTTSSKKLSRQPNFIHILG